MLFLPLRPLLLVQMLSLVLVLNQRGKLALDLLVLP